MTVYKIHSWTNDNILILPIIWNICFIVLYYFGFLFIHFNWLFGISVFFPQYQFSLAILKYKYNSPRILMSVSCFFLFPSIDFISFCFRKMWMFACLSLSNTVICVRHIEPGFIGASKFFFYHIYIIVLLHFWYYFLFCR